MATRYAGLNLLAAEFLAPFGSADRQIGCLESVLGRPTADNWFDSALDMDTVMGATVHQATTMAEHARHLQITGGSPSRIRELTERAALLAERRGMGRVLRLLEVPPPTEVGAAATAQLTSRELAVLALVGRGLSNQEIADTLVISVHTAANHLRSILLKTGCSNRTQAALLAAGAAVGPGQ
jgi:DNA-binding CsgD family transcriptional regulator